MKNKLLKLNCPMCLIEFTTNRRDKIWCDKSCAKKLRDIKDRIDTNYSRQKSIDNKMYFYNLELNKFYFNLKED